MYKIEIQYLDLAPFPHPPPPFSLIAVILSMKFLCLVVSPLDIAIHHDMADVDSIAISALAHLLDFYEA